MRKWLAHRLPIIELSRIIILADEVESVSVVVASETKHAISTVPRARTR